MSVFAIVGSRNFNDYELLKSELKKVGIKKIVTGGAKGADSLAEKYAHEYNIPLEIYKPDCKLGRHAGFLRNKLIVDNSQSVIAFWNGESYGTLSTINHAKKTGKPVTIVVVKHRSDEEIAELGVEIDKANLSEFFTSSSFYEDFKNHSFKVKTPLFGESKIHTYWFYERIKGEYLSARFNLNIPSRALFDLETPKNQVINTNYLARSEIIWLQKPFLAHDRPEVLREVLYRHIVKSNFTVNDVFFKSAVAKVILYRYIYNLIAKSDWPNKGYKSHTSAYALSHLSHLVSKTGKKLDFNQIWITQSVSKELVDILNLSVGYIHNYITKPHKEFGVRPAWLKEEACWNEEIGRASCRERV